MAFRGSSYYLDPSAQSEAWRQVIKREEKQTLRQLRGETDSQYSAPRAPSSCGSFRPPPSVLSDAEVNDRLDRLSEKVTGLRKGGSVKATAARLERPGTGLSGSSRPGTSLSLSGFSNISQTSSALALELDAEKQRRVDAENEVARLRSILHSVPE
jgi:hypothetical protein